MKQALKRHIRGGVQRWRSARVLARAHAVPAPPPLARLNLALVIPVRDDAARLDRLLAQARASRLFAQIVVVDDGSTPPVPPAPDLTLIRHVTPQGGGVARNAGLAAVTCDYLMCFDSDDLLTAELPLLVADLAEDAARQGGFAFCLFRHADSRVMAEPRWGQPDWDDALWAAAGHGIGALMVARPTALPLLAQTANYPWNKIIRTAFLRDHAIACAETQVHNDLPFHWLAFIAADRTGARVLTSDRICAWHDVHPHGGRLTNRRGAERLQVFRALEPVAQAARDPHWQAALGRFVTGLADWIGTVIDPGLRPDFATALADWRARHPGLGS